MKKIFFALLYFGTLLNIKSQTTTLISNGSNWKYLDDGSNQGSAWYGTGFNDASWAAGNAELGYGDGDEATVVSYGPSATAKYITTYFRKVINVPNASSFIQFTINFRRDDGSVIYINGVEVNRNNMPVGTILNTTPASTACGDDGATIQSFTLPAGTLVNGNNTIAVEIHQNNGTSSDITLEFELLGVTSIPPANIVKGPYLQIGTQNSMIVRWETDIATDTKVAYGTSSVALTSSVSNPAVSVTHSILITGLSPYTKYFYSIGTTTAVIQSGADNYFQTSPVPGTAGNYRFWVVGDCGNASTNQINCKNQYITYNGPNKITDGWLLLGDNAYSSGTNAEFNSKFFQIYQPDVMKKMVLWPTPGNHDYSNGASTATTVPYYSFFSTPTTAQAGGVASGNPAYYSYDYGNIHFISLDSYGTVSGNKMYDTLGAQAVWLKADLAANTKRWTIAYWHHPPYTMGSHNSDGEADLAAVRSRFIRILERNKVDLIMCGHSHDYERSKLMKGHYGNEASFNAATHNLSTQSGLYDGSANSCPYLKDSLNAKNGTVYALSGSAGQLGGTQGAFPHNAMHYSNATNGGSFILDIQDNRLDATWLCADGVIRDKFTIYKDVNSVKSYTVLPGVNTTLTASWPGNYLWSNSANSQSIVVNPTTTTTYWVKDPNNCVADTFKIKVLPAVNFTSSPAYCAGNSISFNDLSTNSPISWSWSVTPAVGVTINTPTSQNPIFNFANAGTYSVSLVSNNAYGPGTAVTTTLLIQASPNLTTTSSSTAICNGQTATLSINGANTYTWNTGSNSSSIAVSPSVNTTYTVSGSAVNGCVSSKTISVVSNANPTVNITPSNTLICSGQTATLTAGGATNYTWNPGAITGTVITVSPTSNQTYSITGSLSNGCSNFSTNTISVTTSPTVSVNSATICPGGTATLLANGASSYTWNPVGFNGATFTVSPVSNTTYSIIGANGLCTDVKTASVNIGSSVSISVNTPTICNGQTTTLTANGVSTYTWSTGSNNQSIVVTPASTTSYTISGSSGSCNGTNTTMVTVNSNPTITATSNISLLCIGQNATLTVNGANTYTWNPGGTGNSIVVTPTATTNYSITGTAANGCVGVTAITQSVSTCTGIETIAIGNNSSIVIYPNPNNGTFTIDLLGNETYAIAIYDIASKLIYNGQLQTGNNLIQLKSAPGIYFYNIAKGKQNINTGKIIIQ